MKSIDIKIANAQRRAAEEKAQASLAGNRPTPTMDLSDVKMIAEDVARALATRRAAAYAVPQWADVPPHRPPSSDPFGVRGAPFHPGLVAKD